MAQAKVAISLNEQLLVRLDQLVSQKVFASRSQAIQEAVKEKLDRLGGGRLARECARLDPGARHDAERKTRIRACRGKRA